MNTLTTMKKCTNLTFTLLIGGFLVLGLSACAESQTGDGSDTTGMGSDSAVTGGMQDDGMQGGMQDSVSLQSTNQLLQGGVTSIAMQKATQNIEGWEQKLGNVQAQGEAQTAVSDITNALGQLKSALQGGGQPNMDQVTQAFGQINPAMETLGQNASSLNLSDQQMSQFQSLQQTLSQVPQQLSGGGM
jgi:hypothetical protein